jgi:hypothetical protein
MTIYFLIPDFSDLNDDSIVYLGEGLKEIGIPFFSNKNYWLLDNNGDYLFKKNVNFIPEIDADVVIVSYKWTEHMDPHTFKVKGQAVPKWVLQKDRKFKAVYLDPRDGYETKSYTSEFRSFDLILRSKKNKRTLNYPNIYPWVLGYQERIIREKVGIPIEKKRFEIAVNFNFSHSFKHQLRKWAEEKFIASLPSSVVNRTISTKEAPKDPYSRLMWEQTVKLHNPDYYNHIESVLMVAAFCGDLIPAYPLNPSLYLRGGNKAKLKKFFFSLISFSSRKDPRIIQWDSWRFWETLALGSVPIHIDIEKYGVELPVMPINWKHYIGIDLNKPKDTIERILEEPDTVYKIARDGNRWCLDEYSPKSSATRMLKVLSEIG